MKTWFVGICVAFVTTAWMQSAVAQSDMVDATDPDQLISIIQGLGYKAQLDVDGEGDPVIISAVGGSDFRIYFYGCTEHENCKSLLFKVGYALTDGTSLKVVNDWNSTKLFGRAYLDDDSDPYLELPVNTFGGISRRNFEDTFEWWEVILSQFEKHVDF